MIDIIFSTTSGLYRYDGTMTEIAVGNYFGITKLWEDVWAVANRSNSCLELYDLKRNKLMKVIDGIIGRNAHQIDLIGDRLYATRTELNELDVISVVDFSIEKRLFPNKQAVRGDADFCHFNSIYGNRGKLYLVAHNLGEETGKNSVLHVMSPAYVVIDKIDMPSMSCHNVIICGNDMYCCHSKNSSVVKNGEVVAKVEGCFTRGLSLSDDHLIFGINKLTKNREERIRGAIVVGQERIEVNGAVNEIRQVCFDYGLSNHRNNLKFL